jgi:hypothetical protein
MLSLIHLFFGELLLAVMYDLLLKWGYLPKLACLALETREGGGAGQPGTQG